MSRRGIRCGQIHATDFGWARAFPVASRSEAYETLLLMITQDCILPAYICSNAKEMLQGKFYQELPNAACHLKQLEPYTPWSNTAEREIKELTKGSSHKLLQ